MIAGESGFINLAFDNAAGVASQKRIDLFDTYRRLEEAYWAARKKEADESRAAERVESAWAPLVAQKEELERILETPIALGMAWVIFEKLGEEIDQFKKKLVPRWKGTSETPSSSASPPGPTA